MVGKDFKISYAPKDENTVSKLTEQLYYEDLNSIDDIKENGIVFKTLYIYDTSEGIEVKVFIINSTNQDINLDNLPFRIVNEDDETIIEEIINLSSVGTIPALHARPYTIIFNKESLIKEKSLDGNLKLVVDLKKINQISSSKTTITYLDEKIQLYDRRIIEKYIDSLPAVIRDTYKIIPYKTGVDEFDNKFVIIIISNGYTENISVEGFSILYKDATGLIQACKNIEKLPVIMANSTSVFKLMFDKSEILKENFNPEQCTIVIK